MLIKDDKNIYFCRDYFWKMKFFKRANFRSRIFFAIVMVNLLFMMAMVAFDLYKDIAWLQSVKKQNLIRIETKIQQIFDKTARQNGEKKWGRFQEELGKLVWADNIKIAFYDLKGNLIFGQKNETLLVNDLEKLKANYRFFVEKRHNEEVSYHLFDFIYEGKKPVGIVDISEKSDKISFRMNMMVMMKQYFFAMMIMFVLSGYVAWFISQALMKRVGILARQLPKTNIEYLDTPIDYKGNDEITPLIESYNNMLRKLKHQTEQLAQIEREESWREMAKQIVHEINNPLTPLKLSIQNFQRKYNPKDENNVEKINKLVDSVIHQIDVIHAITRSFSEYSKAPVENDTINIIKTLKHSLDLFPEEIIEFYTDEQELFYRIDETHFTRMITNIVKNGIQSIPYQKKKIEVKLINEPHKFRITIKDNGEGISRENQDKIFERKFTTKSTGMGIGLSIVKKIVEDYNGKIWFDTEEGKGTIFYIEFYK